MSARSRLVARILAPADLAGLAVFRVLFGVVMLVDLARYELAGWVARYYLEPAYLFTFPGFGWVEPLPSVAMHGLFAAMMLASLAVALGWHTRAAAWALALGQTYVFLVAATPYLNHAYLLILVTVLVACVPAHRGLSLDARRTGRGRSWAPAGAQWLLRAQLGVVYVYGGLAKINADWLAGEPVRGWLAGRARTAPAWIGQWLGSEPVVGLVVQGGLWFDLLVTPALLWRRTRVLAVLASLAFHLSNAWLFSIGIFPWFMLVATTLFFDPSWPRRLPVVGPWIDRTLGPVPSPDEVEPPPQARPSLRLGLGAAWLVVQVLVPLRHHLIPGDVTWTEEGHYFAWRMKLRGKSGSARFVVHAPKTDESWVVDPADELTERQLHKMVGKPHLVLQYAHHLARRWQQEHGLEVEVRAQVNVSLNRRPRRLLVDPTVDLTKEQVTLGHAEWILPAPSEPVPRPRP